jgi:hypothetical protein
MQLGLGDGAFATYGEVVFVHQHIQHPADKENGNSGPASSDQVAQMSSWHLFQVEL